MVDMHTGQETSFGTLCHPFGHHTGQETHVVTTYMLRPTFSYPQHLLTSFGHANGTLGVPLTHLIII
jgi:hypothetical protein